MTTSPYTPSQVEMPPSSGVGHDGGFLPMGVPCCHDLDATKRDRFELLSAYLDGEVTSEERQQVLCWLQHDENSRCLYNRLLALRQGMRSQACPTTSDAEAKGGGGASQFQPSTEVGHHGWRWGSRHWCDSSFVWSDWSWLYPVAHGHGAPA